jgi:predicted dehydrogenase
MPQYLSRFHPAIQRVKAIIDSKELGAIKNITASLTAPAGTAPDGDIRWSYDLGGGSTMDPGCAYSATNFYFIYFTKNRLHC